jgi:hypothetical protein
MVWLRHKGCDTPIYEYEGLVPPPHIKSKDWKFADGTHPLSGSTDRACCPDCNDLVFPNPRTLSTVDGSPFWRHEREPPPKPIVKKNFLDRLLAVFSF